MTAAPERAVRLRRRHEAQARIVQESERFNVLQCGRRFGKTTLGVDLAVEAAVDGLPVGWFAPTYKLLDEAWRDVRRAVTDVVATVDKQQRRLELYGGGIIEFWSLDHRDPGRGRKYGRVIVDEAGIVRDLDEIWTQAIRATLTDLKGDAWFLGTPKGKNYFHTLYLRGQTGEPGWKSWRFATVDNPYLDAAEIGAAKRELPDLAFRQEYLGEAVEDGTNPFGLGSIAACLCEGLDHNKLVCSDALPIAYGLDLAKSVDWTVLIGLDGEGKVCRFHRWQETWERTITKVSALTQGVETLVDATGAGDPVLESLRKSGNWFSAFVFSQPSKQQLMEELAIEIHTRAVRFPDGPIRQELEAFEYEFTRTGVRYSAPQGLHDDCVIALGLAVRQRKRRGPLHLTYGRAKAHA